ncbi:MAG: hypothetical protein GC204_04380 [Chloroflexi bacterium]|nr:hypothetical protein [Chloroflexota bacterium]
MTNPLYGIADTHAHFTAQLECGGSFFWGSTYSDAANEEDRLREALGPREGGLTIGDLQEGREGYPSFKDWPRHSTLYYQQAYIEWIRRAYDNGLRLVCCLCVNNESVTKRLYGDPATPPTPLQVFAREFMSPSLPYSDNKAVIDHQIEAVKAMVQVVADEQNGWMQIAYSPEEAREIIGKGKLALVLGIEVDSLGNWRVPADLEAEARQQHSDVRAVIRRELERLYQAGVRQITPIHLSDNPFGGAALYNVIFNTINVDIAGYNFMVEDGFDAGLRYRMDIDGGSPAPRPLLQILGLLELESSDPLSPFRRKLEVLDSHRNRLGLTHYGEMLIEEMMRLGMVIDLDHMSDHTKDRTLNLVEASQYPVIFSHALGFREMALSGDVAYAGEPRRTHYHTSHIYNVPNENQARRSDLERVRDLGGIVSVLLNQPNVRDFDGPNGLKATASATVANNCAGSSRSWAQAYLYALEVMHGTNVALGSDVNGLAGLPGPRFGTNAAYRLEGDSFRDPDGRLRLQQAESQANGVRYKQPLLNAQAERFNGTAYDGDGDPLLSRDIWRALGLFKADAQPKPWGWNRAENIAIGLQAGVSGDERSLICGPLRDECYHQRRAGYLVTSDQEPTEDDAFEVYELYGKIQQVYRRWQAMEGSNYPLDRCTVGQRDFDYNLDGFAHYGMLPDFLQDLHNIGLQEEHTHSLYYSAEAYVQTWEKCTKRSSELFEK